MDRFRVDRLAVQGLGEMPPFSMLALHRLGGRLVALLSENGRTLAEIDVDLATRRMTVQQRREVPAVSHLVSQGSRAFAFY